MAFCARFDSRSRYLYDIDELIIPFHEKKDSLPEFLQAHSKQRIIIDVKENWKDFYGKILQPIFKIYPNAVIRLPEIDAHIANHLTELEIPFFFNIVAIDWEMLYYMASLKPTDIYIGEQLCFELKDVQKAAAKWNFRVRVYPNIAQCSSQETDSLKRFFIRPEDIDLYNRRYISTFEFFIPDDIDLNWDVLYRVYTEQKTWRGPLKEIIQNFDSDLNSAFVSPRWAEFRMTCGRRCLKGYSCDMCNTIYEFSKSLAEMEVMPKLPKDKKLAAKETVKKLDTYSIETKPAPEPPKIPNF